MNGFVRQFFRLKEKFQQSGAQKLHFCKNARVQQIASLHLHTPPVF